MYVIVPTSPVLHVPLSWSRRYISSHRVRYVDLYRVVETAQTIAEIRPQNIVKTLPNGFTSPPGLVPLHSQLTGAGTDYGHLFSMSGALAEAFSGHIERPDLTAPLPNNITNPCRQHRVFRFVLPSSHATSVSIG